MKLEISLSLSSEDGVVRQSMCQIDVTQMPDTSAIGLSLADSKAMLAWIQEVIVRRQIEMLSEQSGLCSCCGMRRPLKDYLNRPGFRGGCLVKVKPGFRSSRRVADSSLPQPRPVEYTQSAPAVGGG